MKRHFLFIFAALPLALSACFTDTSNTATTSTTAPSTLTSETATSSTASSSSSSTEDTFNPQMTAIIACKAYAATLNGLTPLKSSLTESQLKIVADVRAAFHPVCTADAAPTTYLKLSASALQGLADLITLEANQ